MKKTIIFLISLIFMSIANAYEIDMSQTAPIKATTNAKLTINKIDKKLELTFANKSILTNIGIKKAAIRGAINVQNSSVSKITLSAKYLNNGMSELVVENMSSSTGTLDTFLGTQNMLREFQKRAFLKNYFDSFLPTNDFGTSYFIPDLPFYPQAPLKTKENWSIHEESCEEAAILLNSYITNKESFTPEKMNDDIIAMNEFQIRNGIAEDKFSERYKKYFLRDLVNPDEMYNLLGKKYLGYNDNQILKVINPTIGNIEQFVANNHVLTVPMKYTKELRNDFIRPGKTFHIIDIVGYTPDTFITLDPGTKNGRYLSYPKEQLFKSIQENGNYFIALKKK